MAYGNPYAAGSGYPIGPMQQVAPLNQLPFGLAQYAGRQAGMPVSVSPTAPAPTPPQQGGLLGQVGGLGGLSSLAGLLKGGSPGGAAGGAFSGMSGMFNSPQAAQQFAAAKGFAPAVQNVPLPWLQGLLGNMPTSL